MLKNTIKLFFSVFFMGSVNSNAETSSYKHWYFYTGVTNYSISIFPEQGDYFECEVYLPTKNSTFKKCKYKDLSLKCLYDEVINFSEDGTKATYSIYTLYSEPNIGAPAFAGHWVSYDTPKKDYYIEMRTQNSFILSNKHPSEIFRQIYSCFSSQYYPNKYICPGTKDRNLYFEYDSEKNELKININDKIVLFQKENIVKN